MVATVDRQRPGKRQQQNRRTRRHCRPDQQDVDQQAQRQTARADQQRPRVRGRRHAAREGEDQAQHHGQDGDTGADRRGIGDQLLPRGLDLFGGAADRLRAFARGGQRLGLGHRLVPGFLAVQLDHRSLALRRHVGAQARGLGALGVAAGQRRLAAHDTDLRQQHRAGDQRHGHAQVPGEGLAAGHGFTLGVAHGHGGCARRVQQGEGEGVHAVEHCQQDARQQRRLEQRADGHDRRLAQVGQRIGAARGDGARVLRGRVELAREGAQKHDHDRRRDDLSQRARRRDHARRQFRRIAVAQHRRQRQQAHRDHRRADDACRGGQERAHHHDRNRQAAGQRAEDPRHRGQQVVGDVRPLQHDAHQHEHQHRQQRLDALARDDAFVDAVDDEAHVAVERRLPALRKDRLSEARQFRVSEDRDGIRRDARGDELVVRLRPGVDGLVDQQPRAVERGDDAERDDAGAADGEGHRKARQDRRKEREKDDDQPDLDAVQSEKHFQRSLRVLCFRRLLRRARPCRGPGTCLPRQGLPSIPGTTGRRRRKRG